jgi:hypothetical protein
MPSSFIEPCLPSSADRPPSGTNWIHEIKHDGYRLMALVCALPANGRGCEAPQGALVLDRRRDRVLR